MDNWTYWRRGVTHRRYLVARLFIQRPLKLKVDCLCRTPHKQASQRAPHRMVSVLTRHLGDDGPAGVHVLCRPCSRMFYFTRGIIPLESWLHPISIKVRAASQIFFSLRLNALRDRLAIDYYVKLFRYRVVVG